MLSKKEFKSFINFSFLAIIIFAGHYFLLKCFNVYLFAPDVLFIHPFLFLITLSTIFAVKIIFKRTKLNMLGYVYLGVSLVKMFFAVLFLMPKLLNDGMFRKEYVLQFFIIYFIYLAIEVFYLVKQFKNE
ncbi:MAG: hypothetical protein PHH30_04280 [Bacteroidales bacterium]|nr:hypothetical protein [Bacteroidales bacterium]MDD3858989.1 hypothetical protein [Bacteroidales bacterium]